MFGNELLDKTPKAQSMKEKIDRLLKLKTSMKTLNKKTRPDYNTHVFGIQRIPKTGIQNILRILCMCVHISYKEFSKLNNKETHPI